MPYTTIPLLRGFDKIQELFTVVQQHQAYICGGYARYCASPRKEPFPAGDVDIFPSSMESFEALKTLFGKDGLVITYENDVSITYEQPVDKNHRWADTPVIQLIKPVKKARILTYGNIETVLDNFDFTITRVAIIDANTAMADEDFLADEKKTLLKFKNIHCPISSMFRAIKYTKKGYFLQPIEAVKLFEDWTSRDDTYKGEIIGFVNKAHEYEKTGKETLSQEQIEHFEELMMID